MKTNYVRAVSVAVIVVFVLSFVPLGMAQSETQGYTTSFLLLNRPDGDKTYELNITIPQALYQYYTMQSHVLFTDADVAKFVTPYSLKPIADRLWQIYNTTEDFTNGVLMLVHQITYQEVVPGRYPVETLVAGYGDCDLFAYIAASILEAGGIPVVLLYYRDQLHMEIGVNLGNAPTEARVQVYSVNVQNVSYYIAECTGNSSQWRDSWRVGETPIEYQNVSSTVITLGNVEQSSSGQVSAKLRELDHSSLTLKLSSSFMLENSIVRINGQILPKVANENVTLKAQINGSGWITIGSTLTESEGQFVYDWTPPTSGSITLQASWVGNKQYNGSISTQQGIFVIPVFLIALIASLVLTVIFVTFMLLLIRHRKSKAQLPNSTV